ncbi:uncharacterized protein C8Q71DRAFT_127255 [Rhodofomes roseus]|uniref:Secreted protein n=1 Tax=Rhodofomes roseus TaxID=34475 RepID=A0ABQ8KBF5_9APHY|nr:uncharacterized protein C8Q71DRAFT_127255 [Rhodofomes roseus]KAH9834843.1 hypothetical protein C8Q71DRAFT_127255 [Rhodofomes roseus]
MRYPMGSIIMLPPAVVQIVCVSALLLTSIDLVRSYTLRSSDLHPYIAGGWPWQEQMSHLEAVWCCTGMYAPQHTNLRTFASALLFFHELEVDTCDCR